MLALVLAVLAFAPASARAGMITFSGSGPGVDGKTLSASVKFEDDGAGNLTVTLTNTMYLDELVPANILTAVFFDSTDSSLTKGSANLNGSTVIFPTAGGSTPPPGSGNVGGEWAYASNGGGLGSGVTQTQGIGSAGFGIFGPPDRFDTGQNLSGPDSPDGLQYGIAGPGTTEGNTDFNGGSTTPLIVNSVLFTFSGFSGDASTAFSNVRFQYGTGTGEPSFPPGGGGNVVPEPSSIALALTGVLGLGLAGLRRLRRERVAAA